MTKLKLTPRQREVLERMRDRVNVLVWHACEIGDYVYFENYRSRVLMSVFNSLKKRGLIIRHGGSPDWRYVITPAGLAALEASE